MTTGDAQNQRSPFGKPAASASEQAPPEEPGFFAPFHRAAIYIQRQQQIFYRKFSHAIRELKDGYTAEASFGLILIAFLYGVFHAAGPGHGKAVISAYVLANERSLRRGIILASLASTAQAITAIVVTYGLILGLSATGRSIRGITSNLETISFGLVAALGAYMTWRAAKSAWLYFVPAPALAGHSHADHGHDHQHNHNHDHLADGDTCSTCGHAHIPSPAMLDKPLTFASALPIVTSIGLRPCTGAVVVLVFAHTLGLYMAGIAATFAMSVGTAITVSALAILAVSSRDLAAKLFGDNQRGIGTFYRVIALVGAIAVLTLGLVLLYGALTAPSRAFV